MQVNLSLVTYDDININKCLLLLVFLRLEVDSNRKISGSHRLEIQNLQPRLNPIQKIQAPARPDPEKTGLTHPYEIIQLLKTFFSKTLFRGSKLDLKFCTFLPISFRIMPIWCKLLWSQLSQNLFKSFLQPAECRYIYPNQFLIFGFRFLIQNHQSWLFQAIII